jgi:hypothetical protein
MFGTSWGQALPTILLGLVGLWLAHNYRRQIKLKLAERQADAYSRLWELTGRALPDRTSPLDRAERTALYQEMVQWYIEDGNGIFLSMPSRDLYVAVRSNLVYPNSLIKPAQLANELVSMPEADAELRRGCVSIRQISLLRTQLKTDLTIHYGYDYYSDLRADDRAFLKSCGLSLWRKPWRRRLFTRAGRRDANPCVCGMCDPAHSRRGREPSVT